MRVKSKKSNRGATLNLNRQAPPRSQKSVRRKRSSGSKPVRRNSSKKGKNKRTKRAKRSKRGKGPERVGARYPYR